MKGWQYILAGSALTLLLCVIKDHVCTQREHLEAIPERVDTLVIHDTLVSYKPIYVTREKVDSVLVPIADTVMMHDTIFVYLERERVTWRDSLCEVYASGIRVQVDSVTHFTEATIVTREMTVPVKVKTRWGLGISAGYGVGKDGLTPYVGVGISYNILSW